MTTNIKELRRKLNLTQTEFGIKIGRTLRSIQNYESGKRNIDDTTVLLICKTFGVNEKWLREGVGAIWSEDKPQTLDYLSKTQQRAIVAIYDLSDDETNRVIDFIQGITASRIATIEESTKRKAQ